MVLPAPILTEAQCSAMSPGQFRVRASWAILDGATYFVAVVFDPQNQVIAQTVVGGPNGATTALLSGVNLQSTLNYTVMVAQCDQSGTLTSPYSPPFNLQQGLLTHLATVNDLSSITVSATLATVGQPTGIVATLTDASYNILASQYLPGTGGVLALSEPLSPSATYTLFMAGTSNNGHSTGPNQTAPLVMATATMSALKYTGVSLIAEVAPPLGAGQSLVGTVFADGVVQLSVPGGQSAVSIPLAANSLDLSRLYTATLRISAGGGTGPQSPPVAAVLVAPQFDSAYFDGSHIGGVWRVPPLGPQPTGAILTAQSNGQVLGKSTTTLGYRGDIDLTGIPIPGAPVLQAASVFGIAVGPAAMVDLPLSAPVVTAVSVSGGVISAAWTPATAGVSHCLTLRDSAGLAVGQLVTGASKGAIAPPVDVDGTYRVTVQQQSLTPAGVAITGPQSPPVAALIAAPVVTGTRYDGAKVKVSWTAPANIQNVTGYQAQLLDADSLTPTAWSATAAAGATSCDIPAVLDQKARLVAVVRATGTNSTGPASPGVGVIAAAPVVLAADASGATVSAEWTAVSDPVVNGYKVTISDGSGKDAEFSTSTTRLSTANTLAANQVSVTVAALGARATGPSSAAVNLFGAEPSYYPVTTGGAIYLQRASSNQPAPADILIALPDVFTTPPATLPSAGVFALKANPNSALRPYSVGLAANSIAWKFDAASRATLAADFLNFLKAMEMPNGSSVTLKPGALVMLRQTIALALPLLYGEQLLYMYGFNPDAATGGYVDLVPGMRLCVETQVQQITPPANNQTGYVPAGSSFFDVESYADGAALNLGLNAFLSANQRPTVPSPLIEPNAGGGGVIDLYAQTGRQPYLRLLYPGDVKNPKYSGLVNQANLPVILAAASYNILETATSQYVAQGNFSNLANVFGFYFRGRSTLSPLIMVTLNGESHWVTLGATAANLIARAGALPYGISSKVGGFEMRRSIGGLSSDLTATTASGDAVPTNRVRLEYPPAQFSPLQPGFFGLPLFGGDAITLTRRP